VRKRARPGIDGIFVPVMPGIPGSTEFESCFGDAWPEAPELQLVTNVTPAAPSAVASSRTRCRRCCSFAILSPIRSTPARGHAWTRPMQVLMNR
jgi:hypothetical protein